MAVSDNYSPEPARLSSQRYVAKQWTLSEIAIEVRMSVERCRNLMATVKPLNPGERPGRYSMRDFMDRFNEKATESHGNYQQTVTSVKRRVEVARAEKAELSNDKEKKVLVPNKEIVPAMVEFASILSRALDASTMRLKRRYPDLRPAHLTAFQDSLATARNTAFDNFERLVGELELENAQCWEQMRAEEAERYSVNQIEAEQMERMGENVVVVADEW